MSRVVRLKPPTVRDALLASMKEKQWMGWVVRAAQRFGWTSYHVYDSRKSVPGYPDLTLVRERVIFVELKTERGTLTKAQKEWRRKLEAASGVEYYLWRPRHWRQVVDVLQDRIGWERRKAA